MKRKIKSYPITKEKIELLPEQEDLINRYATIINSNGKTYKFMPFWFEKDENGNFYRLHSLGRLPIHLKQLIELFRKDSCHIPKENCHTPEHHNDEIDLYGNCLGCTDKEKL